MNTLSISKSFYNESHTISIPVLSSIFMFYQFFFFTTTTLTFHPLNYTLTNHHSNTNAGIGAQLQLYQSLNGAK